jgi:pyridoxamine 5'-phosphate oxidase
LTKIDIAALGREYRGQDLSEDEVDPDPVEQFRIWFEQAFEIDARDASAMTLATADAAGQPSARIVLLKGFDSRGFTFFTNYGSRKARDIEDNPRGALVFWWTELDRQVRIQGAFERTSSSESAAYFATRPRASQLSATASPQSRVVPNRQSLIEAVAQAEVACESPDVPCPETWGGYRLVPHCFEFWQGRPNRLHDRIRYRLNAEGAWTIDRLAP